MVDKGEPITVPKTCWYYLPLYIDLFHNGDQIWYSFVSMLISPISLAAMGTIQNNGLININTKG